MEYKQLNNKCLIPVIGFGTFKIEEKYGVYNAVKEALRLGYRHIDTASIYFNEEEVGRAIKDSGISRDELWITGKLWMQDYSSQSVKKALDKTLMNLGLEYLDLYLVHQPYGKVLEAWGALEEHRKEGKICSLGVSNMTVKLWNKYVPQFDSVPAVNQVEFHPYCQQKDLRNLMKSLGVVLEGWGPLGQGKSSIMEEEVILALSKKYKKTAAQIILRFEIQEGVVILPKSAQAMRIKENFEVFDFSLNAEDMDLIRSLDTGKGIYNPDDPGVEKFLSKYDVHKKDK